MYVSMNHTEFDVTPYVDSSAAVDEHGKVTHETISLFPYGSIDARYDAQVEEPVPVTIMMSVEEADVIARLLSQAVADARRGRYNSIDGERRISSE
ncbi:hypothetical protein [Mycobacterium sp. HM-7]